MAFGSFDNKSSGSTMSEINMVPLIDVMLVLLVIFIITAPMLSHSIKINVPQATAQPVETEPRVVDLAVNEYGQIFWNEEPVEMDDLAQRFIAESRQEKPADIRIRADLDTRYEILAQVMSSARRHGIKRLGFITRPAPSGPAAEGSPPAAAGAAAPATAAP